MPDNDRDIRAQFNDLVRTELASEPPPECECKCNGAEPHSDRLCQRPATKFVALHRWGWCDEAPDAGGVTRPESVDADGNITSVMCGPCAKHAERVAQLKIKDMLAQIPPWARSQAHCPTCQRPTTTTEDILTVRPL